MNQTTRNHSRSFGLSLDIEISLHGHFFSIDAVINRINSPDFRNGDRE
jgi:hypothetical protein